MLLILLVGNLVIHILVYYFSWYLCLLSVLCTSVVIYWLPKRIVLRLAARYMPGVRTHARIKAKKIAITIDDAPSKDFEWIRSICYENQVNVDFFVLGKHVDTHQTELKAALRSGHRLYNHGMGDKLHALLGTKSLTDEIMKCNEELKSIGVKQIPYFRPGYGMVTKNVVNASKKLDMDIVLSSVYPHDDIIRIPELNFWYIKQHIEPGDIIILHDRPWTAPLLERLLPWLKEEGYEVVGLDELLKQ